MTTLRDALAAEFVNEGEVLQFNKEWKGKDGRVHSMTFDYIEDETVMDRADEVLGLGKTSWTFSPVTDTCVKGGLDVLWPDGTTSHYEDFGYATRADSAEPYKEAVSDAIRRLGRYIGIARYLYHKHTTNGHRPPQPARPIAAARSTPPPAAAPPFEEPPFPGEEAVADDGNCPVHRKPWRENSRGYYCASKLDDGSWCREKPSRAFIARHELASSR